MTKGHRWSLFGAILVTGILVTVISGAISFPLRLIGSAVGRFVATFVSVVSSALVSAFVGSVDRHPRRGRVRLIGPATRLRTSAPPHRTCPARRLLLRPEPPQVGLRLRPGLLHRDRRPAHEVLSPGVASIGRGLRRCGAPASNGSATRGSPVPDHFLEFVERRVKRELRSQVDLRAESASPSA